MIPEKLQGLKKAPWPEGAILSPSLHPARTGQAIPAYPLPFATYRRW